MTEGYVFPPKRSPEPSIPPLHERLTPTAAADLVGVSEATLRNWRSQSKGPSFYRVGRVFYTKADIARWIETRRVGCR